MFDDVCQQYDFSIIYKKTIITCYSPKTVIRMDN